MGSSSSKQKKGRSNSAKGRPSYPLNYNGYGTTPRTSAHLKVPGQQQHQHQQQQQQQQQQIQQQQQQQQQQQISNSYSGQVVLKESQRRSVNDTTMENVCRPRENTKVFKALYDYQSRMNNDISFSVGECFVLLDATDEFWWLMRNIKSGLSGYVPSNYLCSSDNELASYNWFFPQITRQESEQILLASRKPGSFLVRVSDPVQGLYAISLLDEFSKARHYRIRLSPQQYYFITATLRFHTLSELVEYYMTKYDGLAYPLLHVPNKVAPQTGGLGKDTWEISRDSIRLISKLGFGNYGEVWKGLWNNKIAVAVKTLREGKMSRDEFLKEANIMKALRHPKLVQLLAVCTDSDPVYIITEFMDEGSLKHYLAEHKDDLPIPVLLQISIQVADGMSYLESKNYVHRDLAARNVLVGSNMVCKVADFGMTASNEELTNETLAKLPIKWTAPEGIKYRQFTVKSDVWSYGILLWEVLTLGAQPYSNMNNQETFQFVMNGGRLERPKLCSETIYELMLTCWNKDKDKRPPFKDIYESLDKTMQIDTSASKLYNEI